MANLIRAVFAFFWLVASGFVGFLAYIVVQTEGNPHILWGWLVMCAFTFIAATLLAYNIVFGYHHREDEPHHQDHMDNA